jgi:hypothetical protein
VEVLELMALRQEFTEMSENLAERYALPDEERGRE